MPCAVGRLGRPQDRAVAADHDRELAVVGGGVAVDPADDLDLRLGQPELGRLVGQEPDGDVVPAQRVDHLAGHFARLLTPRVGEQEDAARGG